MWEKIRSLLEAHPERLAVARALLINGLAIRGEAVFLNDIEVPVTKIARAVGVDRRTVGETIRVLGGDTELRSLFANLESAGVSLKRVAKQLGLGVVEIAAKDASRVGILAGAARLLAESGISIRQALVDDPELHPDPKLVLIGNREVPGSVIPGLLKIEGIVKVSVY